ISQIENSKIKDLDDLIDLLQLIILAWCFLVNQLTQGLCSFWLLILTLRVRTLFVC
ncbi:Reticulon-4, partial [Bienertia sinuspersici]